MAYNPTWKAAENGLPGNLEATNHAAQVDQFLAVHSITPVYQGKLLWAPGPQTSATGNTFFWLNSQAVTGSVGWLPDYDVSQPFTMPGGASAIGRIQVALQAVGAGADTQVTLYPDSSGSPNLSSPLASTVIPAAALANLTTSESMAGTTPSIISPVHNAALFAGSTTVFNWTQSAVSQNGSGNFATPVTSGNYTIFLGGWDQTASTASGLVSTVQYLGGSSVSNPIPQPSLPKPAYSVAAIATSSAVIATGGNTGTAVLSNVWSASWDPNTGTVGVWTAQTALPQALTSSGVAAWGDYVYVVGGSTANSNASAVASVYWTNASNGQIQSWNSGPPLPLALTSAYVAVVGNWLIVAGGNNTSGTAQASTYYAQINSDGSLGSWQTGPNLPTGLYSLSSQWNLVTTDSQMIIVSGLPVVGGFGQPYAQILSVNGNGLAPIWQEQYLSNNDIGTFQVSAYPTGQPGSWEMVAFHLTSYDTTALTPVPMVSVPLPASGLTAGSTYHLVFHQIGADTLNNYIQLGEVGAPSLNWLYATRYTGGAWTVHSQHAVMVNVFDQTPGGQILHTWEDPKAVDTPAKANQAARSTTVVGDYRGRLLGYCEATALPQDPLNVNPTFGSSVSPWTVANGTFVQSSAQTHGGFPSSGLLTPSGSASFASVASEMIPVTAGQWYTASSWFYSTPGYQVTFYVNFFDRSQNQISSTTSQTTLAAATWTNITFNAQAPAGAAYATLVPTELGTPPATATLYISDCMLSPTDPTTLASVAAVNYPAGAVWPPTGVTQLN